MSKRSSHKKSIAYGFLKSLNTLYKKTKVYVGEMNRSVRAIRCDPIALFPRFKISRQTSSFPVVKADFCGPPKARFVNAGITP
jgi:hypothetical protein